MQMVIEHYTLIDCAVLFMQLRMLYGRRRTCETVLNRPKAVVKQVEEVKKNIDVIA